jgi:hypothetical protein
MIVWGVFEEVNEYDQCGDKLLGLFRHQPDEKDLVQFGHTHFGRENNEYSWVYKEEVEVQ